MRIYTKTGDDGTTGLFGAMRVRKDDPRVEAYGTVDELNSVLGLIRAEKPDPFLDGLLERIQTELFAAGAELACAPGKEATLPARLVSESEIQALEHAIDTAEADLAPLRNFVLPGGTRIAAELHLARTVCRRAERHIITAQAERPLRNELVIYVNRLSDLLFVLARRENHRAGVEDIPWAPRAERQSKPEG